MIFFAVSLLATNKKSTSYFVNYVHSGHGVCLKLTKYRRVVAANQGPVQRIFLQKLYSKLQPDWQLRCVVSSEYPAPGGTASVKSFVAKQEVSGDKRPRAPSPQPKRYKKYGYHQLKDSLSNISQDCYILTLCSPLDRSQ